MEVNRYATNEGKVWLREKLKSQVMTITFKKKDGTNREMLCTLDPKYLPAIKLDEETDEKSVRKQSIDAIAVYDVEVNAWRSFRYDSVIEVNYDTNSGKSNSNA
jgi:hypothetical protein